MTTAKIIHGDCIEVMRKMAEANVDLVFADPPYNQGVDYGDVHSDRLSTAEYRQWTYKWLSAAYDTIRQQSAFWVLSSESWADYIGETLRILLPRRNRIIWHERFSQYDERNFTKEHRHLFYHANAQSTWNPDPIRVQSVRQKMGDKRAKGPRVPGNVWLASRVQGNNGTRVPWHPAQLHAPSLERIVLCSTNPGDTVLEPFSGSAILGVICKQLGRNYIGIDSNPEYVRLGQERIDATEIA